MHTLMTAQNLTNEQRAHIECVNAIIADREAGRVDPANVNDYVLTVSVSGGLTSGPSGSNADGWITYTAENKVYYVVTEFTHVDAWPLAVGGLLPLLPALAGERLRGKTGQYVANGRDGLGEMQMYVDKLPVLRGPLPLVGVGLGRWSFRATVKFS